MISSGLVVATPIAKPKKKRRRLPPPIVTLTALETIAKCDDPEGPQVLTPLHLVFEIINLELPNHLNNNPFGSSKRAQMGRANQRARIRHAIRLHLRSFLELEDMPRCVHCECAMPWIAPKLRSKIPCDVRPKKKGKGQICQPASEMRGPVIVQITRIGNGNMQIDGLWSACKPVVDGIADAFGVDDKLLYEAGSNVLPPKQEKRGPGVFGVVVDLMWPEQEGA